MIRFKGATSVADVEVLYKIHEGHQECEVKDFLEEYKEWMQKGHNINGLDKFTHLSYANGTTEVFDKFYLRHLEKRLRFFKGEYYYHSIAAREWFRDRFAFIEDDVIKNDDVVVISIPFSDTGNLHFYYDWLMKECCEKNVPVLIDMAYINLTKNFELSLDYDCIETVATSLSKVFPVQYYRIGMRLNKEFRDDTLDAYTDQNYVNQTSVNMGCHLINNFSNTHTYNKYINKQKKICWELDVEPSDCVIFGIDKKNFHPKLNRGGKTNRLCFSRLWGNNGV